MRYSSSKTFGHDLGLSCCFRQWRAKSHCASLHGYALAIRLDFVAEALDENGWVVDFGSFQNVREHLRAKFDHATLVAQDDPELDLLKQLHVRKVARVIVVPRVGCEAFAAQVFTYVQDWVDDEPTLSSRGVRLVKVEVREHGANAAGYSR